MEYEMSYKDKYRRKHFIMLCFNDEEMSVIKNICCGDVKAQNLRNILLSNNKQFKKIFDEKIKKNESQKLAFELNKIGVNLNQIAKKINENVDKFIDGNGELFVYEIDKINETLNKIKGDFYDT